jgi:hypothetical protein
METIQRITPTPAAPAPQTRSTIPPIQNDNSSGKAKLILPILAIVVLIAGGFTGRVLATKGVGSSTNSPSGTAVGDTSLGTNNEVGIADAETFKDTAEGILEAGGKDGEGTHKLNRGLGGTKDVYLTSTAINLDNFVGKKVQVWGQTIAGQKVGWLMDVGRIKILE